MAHVKSGHPEEVKKYNETIENTSERISIMLLNPDKNKVAIGGKISFHHQYRTFQKDTIDLQNINFAKNHRPVQMVL